MDRLTAQNCLITHQHGMTVERLDNSGRVVHGVSFPASLARARHLAGQCQMHCRFCLGQAINDLQSRLGLRPDYDS